MQAVGDSAPVLLPNDMNLMPKAQSAPCTSKKINVQPLSGSLFNPNDTSKFEIPVGINGQYLDPTQTYLILRVKNVDPAGAPWFVDHSAASFIQKLEVYSSSQLIETINAYNVLYAGMLDAQLGGLDRQSYMSITSGCEYDNATPNAINLSRGGIQVQYGQTATFCINLFSGVIGTGCSKNLPIGDLSDLRLEIQFETSANAVVSGTTTGVSTPIWQVVSTELALQVLSLDSGVNEMMHASHRGAPIMISSEMYRNYNSVIAGNNSSISTIIPLKFTSIKSLVGCFRTNNNLNSYANASISSRINPFASSGTSSATLQVLAGNTYLPQVGMRYVPEIYTEFAKAWHALGNINSKTMMCKNTYDLASEPTAPVLVAATTTIASIAANVVTTTAAHGLVAGSQIFYTGATVNGLTANTAYAVLTAPSGTTFTLGAVGTTTTLTLTNATGRTDAFVGYVTPSTYWQNTPSFMWGINMDAFYLASDKSYSGMNTNPYSIFLNGTYSAAQTVAQRQDTFAHYDSVLLIDPSTKQMSVRV